jgi:ankyrin repeat protein
LVGPILELGDLDLEYRDARGRTLLLAACRSRLGPDSSIDAAKFKAGIKDYSIDHIHTDKPSLVDFFLARGSCATVQDNDGKNALHHLLQRKPRGGLGSLRRLVSHVPELTHQIDLAGDSPLHYALRRYDTFGGPDTEAIEILMEAGADIRAPDAQGNIALHHLGTWLAEHSDRKEEPAYIRYLFRRLVSVGLPINARNHRGETPFFSFISSQGTYRGRANRGGEEERQLAALNMLLELGADVLTTNDEGDTLLHVVASSDSEFYGDEGEVEMIQRFRWLLDQGLDLLHENAKNQTCLDVAAQMENEPILKLYQRKA